MKAKLSKELIKKLKNELYDVLEKEGLFEKAEDWKVHSPSIWFKTTVTFYIEVQDDEA